MTTVSWLNPVFYGRTSCLCHLKATSAMDNYRFIVVIFLLTAFLSGRTIERRGFPVEFRAFDAEILSGCVWDVSRLSAETETGSARAYRDSKNGYFETLGWQTRIYVCHGDTMYYRGWHIGRGTGVLCDGYVPVFVRNVPPGVAFETRYEGSGSHDVDMRVCISGDMEGRLVGTGTFIPAVGDTVRNVTLTCERSTERTSIYDPASADEASEAGCGTGVSMVIYRWYLPGARMPIAIQCEVAALSPPEGAEAQSAMLYVMSANEIGVDDDDVTTYSGYGITPELSEGWLGSAEISVSGNVVTVSLPALASPVRLDVYVMDTPGNIYGHSAVDGYDGTLPVDVPLHNAGHGSYIVSMIVDGNPELTEKRIITL